MNKEDFKRDFILLNAGYAVHDADWNWKNVYSPFARIHLVDAGAARIVCENRTCRLEANHLYLTPSYARHAYECDGLLRLYYLHIYEDSGKNPGILERISFPVGIEADPLIVLLVKRLIEINPLRGLQFYDPRVYDNSATLAAHIAKQKNSSMACRLETQGILRQLISRFLASAEYKNEHIDKRILRTLHYVHKNMEDTIDLECLAELCCLTKDHFIRLFKKEMHCTPGKYINRKKMETAQRRMLIDGMSVKNTAYSLGFDSISYFTRLFTKITGESPGNYRKKVLPQSSGPLFPG
jgi:AraC-like DNA-binding protein